MATNTACFPLEQCTEFNVWLCRVRAYVKKSQCYSMKGFSSKSSFTSFDILSPGFFFIFDVLLSCAGDGFSTK